MNRTELVRAVAQHAGVSQDKTARVLRSLEDVVKTSLVDGEDIVLSGFGVFQVRTQKIHKILRGVEYSTLRKIVSFRPSRPLKAWINGDADAAR